MVVAALLAGTVPSLGDAALSPNYYDSSCPNLESIVRYEVSRKINLTVVTIPATLRLVFHDCLVGVRNNATPCLSPFLLKRSIELALPSRLCASRTRYSFLLQSLL